MARQCIEMIAESKRDRSAVPSAGFARAIRILGGGTEEHAVRRVTTVGRGAKPPSEVHFPYKNSGSQSVMPGQMYMNARQIQTMTMYGIMPAKIWFSVTCFGDTPFR